MIGYRNVLTLIYVNRTKLAAKDWKQSFRRLVVSKHVWTDIIGDLDYKQQKPFCEMNVAMPHSNLDPVFSNLRKGCFQSSTPSFVYRKINSKTSVCFSSKP